MGCHLLACERISTDSNSLAFLAAALQYNQLSHFATTAAAA